MQLCFLHQQLDKENKTNKHTFSIAPCLTEESGFHYFENGVLYMIAPHLSYDGLDNVGLFLKNSHTALHFFLSTSIKLCASSQLIELQNEVFACECQYSLYLFVFSEKEEEGVRGGGGEGLISSAVALSLVLFSHPVL